MKMDMRDVVRAVVPLGFAVALRLVVASCSGKKEDETKKPEPIGLVLSGGAGKGAYEVGVWQELQAAGLASRITVISGTSIGAINAALFATRPDDAERIWLEHMVGAVGVGDAKLSSVKADVGPVRAKVSDALSNAKQNFVSATNEMRQAVEAYEDSAKWYIRLFNKKRQKQLKQESLERGFKTVNDMSRAVADLFEGGLAIRDWSTSNRIETTELESSHEGFVDAAGLSDLLTSCLPESWPSNVPSVYATAVKKAPIKSLLHGALTPSHMRVESACFVHRHRCLITRSLASTLKSLTP